MTTSANRAYVQAERLTDGSIVFNVLMVAEGHTLVFGAETGEHAHELAAQLNRTAFVEVRT